MAYSAPLGATKAYLTSKKPGSTPGFPTFYESVAMGKDDHTTSHKISN